jgi:tRNA nucleotidyltransferase (CCA-adding enzyme)
VIDLVTARAEYYAAPTALPEVERGSLKSDLRRRDFTINALALSLDPDRFGEIIDYFNGLQDIAARSLKVLHSLSFVEDPTRILRAARLEARLQFRIEARTEELVPDAVGLIDRVSGARLMAEIRQLHAEDRSIEALERLDGWGVLHAINPGLTVGDRLGRLFDALPAVWSFWVTVYSGDANGSLPAGLLDQTPSSEHKLLVWLAEQRHVGVEAARRLRLTAREASRLRDVLRLTSAGAPLDEPEVTASTLYDYLIHVPADVVAVSWLLERNAVKRANLLRFAAHLAGVRTEIGGEDLERLGAEQGPMYGRVLQRVLHERLEGSVTNREEELALARQLLAEETSTDSGD